MRYTNSSGRTESCTTADCAPHAQSAVFLRCEPMLFRAGRRPFIGILIAAFVGLFATTGFAQAVVDPVTAEFDPSADHNALDTSGAPLVNYYLLAFYSVGGQPSGQHINL